MLHPHMPTAPKTSQYNFERETRAVKQRTYPGLAIGANAEVVAISNSVAAHPPCKFPRRLQCSGLGVKLKVVVPFGALEAETRTM